MFADTVLINTRIYTMDEEMPEVEALVIRGEKIVYAGTTNQAREMAGDNTDVIDLRGKVVLPGFIDTHNHMYLNGMEFMRSPISEAESINDVLEIIHQTARDTEPGKWIISQMNCRLSRLKEKRYPAKNELDKAAPHNPVFLPFGMYVAVVNTLAVKKAGINEKELALELGKAGSDAETGEFNGLLPNRVARMYVEKFLPNVSDAERITAVKTAMANYNAAGITGVTEPGLTVSDIRIYQQLWSKNELTVRSNLMFGPDFEKVMVADSTLTTEEVLDRMKMFGVSTGFGDSFMRISGIKLIVDGGFNAGLRYTPYPGSEDYFGVQYTSTERIKAVIELASETGWQLGIHTVGDKAIDITTELIQEYKEKKFNINRPILFHCFMPSEQALSRMQEFGILAGLHPQLWYTGGGEIKMFCPDIAEKTLPLRECFDRGLTVPGGSDSPIGPYQPLHGIWTAVTRNIRGYGALGKEQAISVKEAVKMYTSHAAYATFEENIKGTLKPGMLADLVVLDKDIFSIPPEEIKDVDVIRTMVGGKTVYQKSTQ